MSRLRRIEHGGRYFFVTTNLARGVPPLTPKERGLCLEHIDKARAKHGFSLFAYVVMPDHLHLLLAAFQSSLPDLMREWKSKSASAIAKLRGKRAAIWQPRYFDFILRRASDFGKKLEYIHDNPVSAGLVAQPEDWFWSSAAFYVKKVPVLVRPDLFDVPVDPNTPLWPVPWR
jgi:putative transposase